MNETIEVDTPWIIYEYYHWLIYMVHTYCFCNYFLIMRCYYLIKLEENIMAMEEENHIDEMRNRRKG